MSFSKLSSCSADVFIGNECDSGDVDPVDTTDDELEKLVGDVDTLALVGERCCCCSIVTFLPFISSSSLSGLLSLGFGGHSAFDLVDTSMVSSSFGVDAVNDVDGNCSSGLLSFVDLIVDCVS